MNRDKIKDKDSDRDSDIAKAKDRNIDKSKTNGRKTADPVHIRPLPRYEDIPDVGLLLDQSARLVNMYLEGFAGIGLTNSMISNYVKHGILPRPVRKLYYREQLASLIFIALSKSVLSLEDISRLLEIQRSRYNAEDAYMLFKHCLEAELDQTDAKSRGCSPAVSSDMIISDEFRAAAVGNEEQALTQGTDGLPKDNSEKQSPSGYETGSDSGNNPVRTADNMLLTSLVRAISDGILLRRLIGQTQTSR